MKKIIENMKACGWYETSHVITHGKPESQDLACVETKTVIRHAGIPQSFESWEDAIAALVSKLTRSKS